ncbi:MAG: DUF4012 domain-containing protein [Patescibacteria group bacterium]
MFNGRDFESNEQPRPKRSLEDQLASVIEEEIDARSEERGARREEREDIDDSFLAPRSSLLAPHFDSRPRRRRRRYRTIERVRSIEDDASRVERDDAIANLDRVVVGFSRSQPRAFKNHVIPVRFGDHDRSPFVVSLRGIALFMDPLPEDERIPEQAYVHHDIATEGIPNIETLRSLADDLVIHASDMDQDADDQFTNVSLDEPRIVLMREEEERGARSEERENSFFSRSSLLAPRSSFLWKRLTGIFSHREAKPHHIETRRLVVRAVMIASVLGLIAAVPAGLFGLVRDLLTQRIAVASAGESAVNALSSADQGSLMASSQAFRDASEKFRATDDLLSRTNAVAIGLAQLIPSTRKDVKSAHALLQVGSSASDAAHLLTQGLEAVLSPSNKGLLERLAALTAYAESAQPLLDEAAAALKDVDPSVIPPNALARFDSLSTLINDGQLAVREFMSAANLLATIMGRDEPRRYLVIFQNPNELRPTGGFMGSFAELDVDKGKISHLEIPGGGTYDLQGQLISQIIPPPPLQLVASRWEFQDSNWSPDFASSAKTIRYFWEKSGGYSVDGIIAVNATVVRDLLALTGPIELPELGKTITSDNFMDETQKAVELEYDKTENKPKKILSLMAPIMMKKLSSLDRDGMIRAFGILTSSIDAKDIQIALTNDDEMAIVNQEGWSGQMKTVSGDALAVVEANIAGQKTDGVIHEAVKQNTNIAEDGSITDDVTLTRTHAGIKRAQFNGVRNVSYIRLYVPRGSTLLDASGFNAPDASFFQKIRDDAVPYPDPDLIGAEASSTPIPGLGGVSIWDEGDRTVIGGWNMVDPGQEAVIRISYRLPFSAFDIRDRLMKNAGPSASDAQMNAVYSMLYTSQSGKPDRTLETSIHAPSSWNVTWTRDGGLYSGPWNHDLVISALYDTKKE